MGCGRVLALGFAFGSNCSGCTSATSAVELPGDSRVLGQSVPTGAWLSLVTAAHEQHVMEMRRPFACAGHCEPPFGDSGLDRATGPAVSFLSSPPFSADITGAAAMALPRCQNGALRCVAPTWMAALTNSFTCGAHFVGFALAMIAATSIGQYPPRESFHPRQWQVHQAIRLLPGPEVGLWQGNISSKCPQHWAFA